MAPRDTDQRANLNGEHTEVVGENPSSYPGLTKYPTGRDIPFRLAEDWIEGKRKDDNIGNFWRIHDKLYNLEPYINKHPGGPDWLSISRGLDITEAFESAHMVKTEMVERILKEFYIGEATSPRISPFTLKEDGFFKTLKRKSSPILKRIGSGPTQGMKMMEDSLIAGFVIFGALGAIFNSWICCFISGSFLATAEIGAHNFFHLKDTWRRYYFDFGLGSSYEWRITHFFSHHLFPNTLLDIELKLCPTYEFLPHFERSWAQRFLPIIYSHVLYCFLFWIDFVKRWYHVLNGNKRVRPENLIVIFEMLLLMLVAPNAMSGFMSWLFIHTSASFQGVFIETLKEFEEEWIKFPHWELYLGCYKQLARTEKFNVKQLREKIDKTSLSF